MQLFFISSLRNFNDVFSLEYIIPPKIFEKLYNYTTTKYDIEKEFVTLYKKIPTITKDEFIIELNLDDKDIIYLTENIALNPFLVPLKINRIIFKDENVKKIYMGRSLLVSEIKDTEYYISKFTTIDEVDIDIIKTNIIKGEGENLDNVMLSFQSKIITLYDKLLGGLYYSSYINSSSIVCNKRVYDRYAKIVSLNKVLEQLKSNNLLFKNTKFGLTKDIISLKLRISKDIKNSKSALINISPDLKLTLNNNYKFNYKGIDSDILNLLINNLLKADYNFSQRMQNIGREIKEIKHIDNRIIEEYRVVYDICVNGNLSYDIKDIRTEVLKCFLIALLKKDSVKEAKELSSMHHIKNNTYIYFFIGLIKGYSGMSKIIKRDVDNDNISKLLILKEFNQIQSYLNNYYKKELYKMIIDLKRSDSVFKIRSKLMNGELLPMKLKARTGKNLDIIFKTDEYIYTIKLYKYIVRGYKDETKKLNIRTNNNGEYRSFRIKRESNQQSNALNELDYYNLYKVLSEYKKEN